MRLFSKLLTRLLAAALVVIAVSGFSPRPAGAEQLAKNLFGSQRLPAASPTSRSFGFYSKGCFAGGVAIATDGPTWQAMRLSRNRRWGHPRMIGLVEKLSRAAVEDGWPGLLLGDISQPRGGPMRDGHASHQIGLDADIWLTPMPGRKLTAAQRETVDQVSIIKKGGLTVNERLWTDAHMRLLKRAASYSEVERLLVHPGIKKKLCETVTGDRDWLSKVRPFWGHDAHFHIRIGCQPGSNGCKAQSAPPPGDGCGKPLAWWFTAEPWRPNKNPDAPKARDLMTLKSLPKECRAVLDMPSPPSEVSVTIGGDGAAIAVMAAPEPVAAADPASNLPPPFDDEIAPSAFAPTPDTGVPVPRLRPGN